MAIVGLFFNFTILALGFTIDFLGVLNSLSFVVSVALSLPLLWALGWLPLRVALISSAMLQATGVLLISFWPQGAILFIASGSLGAAAVLFDISAAPFMMRHSEPATRDRLFSTNSAIRVGLAGVGSLIAGQMPALLASRLAVSAQSSTAYRATLGIAGYGFLLSIVPLLLIPKKKNNVIQRDAQSTSRVATPWRTVLHQPRPLLRLLISPALISLGAALIIPYLNLFFKQRFVVSDQMLGFIFAGLGVSTGLAALAAPRLSARIGKMPTIIVTEALGIPFLLILGFSPQLGIVVGAALARAALFNMGTPLYDAFAMEKTDEPMQPTMIALINGAYSIGYLFGPLISTSIQTRYGFAPIFILTALCYSVAVWAKYHFFLRQRSN